MSTNSVQNVQWYMHFHPLFQTINYHCLHNYLPEIFHEFNFYCHLGQRKYYKTFLIYSILNFPRFKFYHKYGKTVPSAKISWYMYIVQMQPTTILSGAHEPQVAKKHQQHTIALFKYSTFVPFEGRWENTHYGLGTGSQSGVKSKLQQQF